MCFYSDFTPESGIRRKQYQICTLDVLEIGARLLESISGSGF